MKKTQNLAKSDKWIVGLTALCALLLFSWLVYDIAFLNPLLQGQIKIGKIYETQNRVKRKFNKSLIWYAAEQNETVYENDWIFTGSQSIAKIKLDSGGEIIIEPDSLIILSRKNGVLQLDLQHGRLMADVKSGDVKINVVRDGETQSIDTGDGLVSVAQREDSEEEALIDTINLDKNKDGKEDETLSDLANRKYYDPDKGYSELDVNGLSFNQTQQFDYNLLKGQTASSNLDWVDPFARWKGYEIEISSDPNFNNILAKNSGKDPNFKFNTKNPGQYYWRVRGLDADGNPSIWSEGRDFAVNINYKKRTKPVQLAREKLLYQLEKSDLANVKPNRTYDVTEEKPIKIEWEKNEDAAIYKVEISDKPDFSNIVEQKLVKDNTIDLKNIQLGNTYFRVTPETDEGVPIAEEAQGKVTTYFPPPPEDSLETVDKKEFQVMKWDHVPYAEAYQVSYKTDKNDEKEKVEYVVGNKLKVENKTGFLQWKVRVVDPETKKWMSSNSTTVDWYDAAKRLASLHGSGQAGSLYPEITRPEARKTFISVNDSPLFIVMNWDYARGAPHYQVEISKNPNMADLVYEKRVDRKRAVINQKFRPGIYYMRVRAVTEDVTQESWSEVEVFRVINRKAR